MICDTCRTPITADYVRDGKTAYCSFACWCRYNKVKPTVPLTQKQLKAIRNRRYYQEHKAERRAYHQQHYQEQKLKTIRKMRGE